MDDKSASTDSVVAEIASRQHGVVSASQLRIAGVSKDSVWKAVAAGRLHRIYRGVYAVGHRGLGNEGKWMAAVLAGGRGAVLSHCSAAELWQLLPPRVGSIDITIPTTSGRRRRPGIRVHRSPSLTRSLATRRNGIAVTTPARTIADLRRSVPETQYRKALRQAEFLGLDLGEIESDHTRSELERAFLALCRRHGLPLPEVNVRVGRHTVDFLWRQHRLVVETDGYAAHRGRQAFEDDRARDLELHARGYRVRRFTDRQVHQLPRAVADAVRGTLAG
jgi:very-short-patch-repair endonuclease